MIRTLFLFLLSFQSVSPEVAQHMQAGVEAHKQGHLDVAIAEFRKASESDPTLIQAFLNLGQVYAETGNYASAIPALRHALELDPNAQIAHLQLGYALLSQGYAAEAIPHLQKAGATDVLGIAQIETGQYEDAIANLSSALTRHPGDPDLLFYLGRASGLLSKRANDTLIANNPDSARTHQAMGENYFVLRQMPQAEKEFTEALRQHPEIRGLHLELGLVYAGAAQWSKAEEAFRAETKLQPGDPEAAYRLGSALLQQGKAREARVELQRADTLLPDMPETLYSLGKAASLEGDSALAEKSWNRLLGIEKDSLLAAQAHFGLAALYRKQGKTAEAQQHLHEFQRLQSTTNTPRVE